MSRAFTTCARTCARSVLYAGRWGPADPMPRLSPIPQRVPDGAAPESVTASVSHALVACAAESSSARTWCIVGAGHDVHGQLGGGTCASLSTALLHADWARGAPHLAVAAGNGFSCASTGRALYAWGTGVRGQTALGAREEVHVPARVQLPDEDVLIEAVAAGLDHIVVLALHTDGQLGRTTGAPFSAYLAPIRPLPLHADEQIALVRAGGDTSLAATSAGRVFVWGNNEYGQGLDAGNTADQIRVPTESAALEMLSARLVDAQIGGSFVLLLDADGAVYSAGYGATGRRARHSDALAAGLDRTVSRVSLPARCVRIAAGLHYAAAATDDGLYVWGIDQDGRLGLGPGGVDTPCDAAERRVPTPQCVNVSGHVVDVACGGESMVVLIEAK
ncbi:hypothetical protein MSPP1_004144 [Malassezia sp. CBS 17886]|nr:hypothetical protein MSPP1_004144 [Malassezia sp. CBS 17886]